jgi:hypothetical protein
LPPVDERQPFEQHDVLFVLEQCAVERGISDLVSEGIDHVSPRRSVKKSLVFRETAYIVGELIRISGGACHEIQGGYISLRGGIYVIHADCKRTDDNFSRSFPSI